MKNNRIAIYIAIAFALVLLCFVVWFIVTHPIISLIIACIITAIVLYFVKKKNRDAASIMSAGSEQKSRNTMPPNKEQTSNRTDTAQKRKSAQSRSTNPPRTTEPEKTQNTSQAEEPTRHQRSSKAPTRITYANPEEKSINVLFTGYEKTMRTLILPMQQQIDKLHAQAEMLNAHDRFSDARNVLLEAKEKEYELNSLRKTSLKCFDSTYVNRFAEGDSIRTRFYELLLVCPNDRVAMLDSFFQAPLLRCIKTEPTGALILSPGYVIIYNDRNAKRFSVVTYDRICCSNGVISTSDGSQWRTLGNVHDSESIVIEYASYITSKYANAVQAMLEHRFVTIAPSVTRAKSDNVSNLTAEQSDQNERQAKNTPHLPRHEQTPIQASSQTRDTPRTQETQRNTGKTAMNQNFESEYTVVGDTITDWNGKGKHLKVESSVAKVIGTAFRWKTSLESVTIEEGYTRIMESAFLGASSLVKVKLAGSIKRVGREAFKDCVALEYVELAEGIEAIDDDVFRNCHALKSITFPNSVRSIGKNVFAGCEKLEHVTFGSGISIIEQGFFDGFYSLCSVTVSSSLKTVADCAFQNCVRLKSITFIDNAKDKGCNIEYIGKYAFYGCEVFGGIENLTKAKTIDEYAFCGCVRFSRCVFSDKLQYIGDAAFLKCSALDNVVISDSIWRMKGAFCGTPWLENQVDVNGFCVSSDYLECYAGSSTKAYVPVGIKTIGSRAFFGNSTVQTIEMLEGVVTIQRLAFSECKSLKCVVIPESVIEIADDAFLDAGSEVGLEIFCYRRSTASTFGQRKRIKRNYLSKQSADGRISKPTNTTKAVEPDTVDYAQQVSQTDSVAIPTSREQSTSKIEYIAAEYDSTCVRLELSENVDTPNKKVITAGYFRMSFVQNVPVSDNVGMAEYEVLFIDENGNSVSNTITIKADKKDISDLAHTATFNIIPGLSSGICFLIIKYANGKNEYLTRVEYTIDIAFALDF